MIPFPNKKYNTIVLDPPWKISLSGKNIRRKNQAKKLDYGTMELDEIKGIHLSKIANKGCHVYCWTTNKFLRHTFDVLENWGVHYHLTLVWTKHNGMTPNFAYKFATEFCLLGFYGKPMQKFLKCGKLNWVHTNAPKKHSQKPLCFFDLVDEMSPSPKLEMFARDKKLGWDAWGNEV